MRKKIKGHWKLTKLKNQQQQQKTRKKNNDLKISNIKSKIWTSIQAESIKHTILQTLWGRLKGFWANKKK